MPQETRFLVITVTIDDFFVASTTPINYKAIQAMFISQAHLIRLFFAAMDMSSAKPASTPPLPSPTLLPGFATIPQWMMT